MKAPETTASIDVPVLIVGGGPVGLMSSIYLSRFGVRSLLVERHPSTAVLPKARSINARTMEMFRQLGFEGEVRAAGMDPRFSNMIMWAESLTGEEIKRVVPGSAGQNRAYSPTRNCGCAQDLLEPILRRHAQSSELSELRFGVQMKELSYDNDGATGVLVDMVSGETKSFKARYVIGADGSQSSIRRQLGVQMRGERDVYDSVNIHFKADLTQWVDHRPAALYLIEQPDLRGTFLTINGSTRWSFLVTSMSAYGYKPEQFTHEFCAQIIRQAVGDPALSVEVLGVGTWRASAIVADRYRDGPIFLVGDSAHEMPPTGGLGLNTGVQDAQNLAWKLAAVLKGEATEQLLDTYDAERRPLGELTTRTSLLNALSMGRTQRQSEAVLPRDEYLNERGIVFGFRYASNAVIAEEASVLQETASSVTEYRPSAAPGGRAAHTWLLRDGEPVSTIDLFGGGFVLFAGPEGGAWKRAAQSMKHPGISAYVVGQDLVDADRSWAAIYDIGARGAVLVRPDGVVAWRSRDGASDAASVLSSVMANILGAKTPVLA